MGFLKAKSTLETTHMLSKPEAFCLNECILQPCTQMPWFFQTWFIKTKKYINATPPLLDYIFIAVTLSFLSLSLSLLHALSFSQSFFLLCVVCVCVCVCVRYSRELRGEQCDKLVMHAHNKLILLCSVTESRCCMQWCMWMSSMTTVH